jgi:hypothetical protein
MLNPLKKLQIANCKLRKRLSTKSDRKMEFLTFISVCKSFRPVGLYLFWCFFALFTTNSNFEQLQGADNKLGQFLGLDI